MFAIFIFQGNLSLLEIQFFSVFFVCFGDLGKWRILIRGSHFPFSALRLEQFGATPAEALVVDDLSPGVGALEGSC